jgi:hypothetical protein
LTGFIGFAGFAFVPELPTRAKRPAIVAAAMLRCNSFIIPSDSPQALADKQKIELSLV